MTRVLRAALGIAAILWAAAPAGAVLYIDINAPGGKRMPIAVADFHVAAGDNAMARALPAVIASDLSLTSLFDPIPREAHLERIGPAHFAGTPISFPDWKIIGAEAVVIGTARQEGDRITVEMRLYDATLGTMMAGKRYAGPAKSWRRIAHRFANEILYAFTGIRGIFDTEIAFSARPEGGRGKEIWVVGVDGEGLRKLTDNRTFNLFPRWSPDGQQIAYTSYRTGAPRIWVRNLADGTDRQLPAGGNANSPGSFSPDGRYLYGFVSTGGNSDIQRLDLSRGEWEPVATGFGLEVSPSVSPDGTRIAFVSDRGGSPQVYVKTVGGREERRISFSGPYATSPAWSPAGDRIAYTVRAGGLFSIYTVAPDGSREELLASGDGNCQDPSFSPDGRYVVYTFRKKGYSELRIVSVDGRAARTVFKGLTDLGSPSWSPRR